jgi:hypothetical protein
MSVLAIGLAASNWYVGNDCTKLRNLSRTFDNVCMEATKRKDSVRVDRIGGYVDDVFAWNVELPKEKVSVVIESLGVSKLQKNESIPANFWELSKEPWWTAPDAASSKLDLYASPGFTADSRGLDGEYFFVVHMKLENRLYVWHKWQLF